VDLEQILKQRTEELYSSTRSEILVSIGSALLFIGVMAWRIGPAHDPLEQVGFAAIVVWVIVSLYWFRYRIRRRPPRPDAAAAAGLEYYRGELERRRDHLKNEWLWHGPLFLACVTLFAILTGHVFSGYQPLRNILPLLVLLPVWAGFSFRRRLRQAKELEREIDELAPLGR
jgi:hypothetical protein